MSVNFPSQGNHQRKRVCGLARCLIITTFIVVGCSHAVRHRDTLEVAIEAQPLTLDPRVASDAFGDKIGQLIFNGLFRRDDHLDIVPDLALRYEQPRPTTYRIFLRQDVRFHNGDPLTADDVAYTIRSILDGKVASPYRAAFDRVTEVVVENPFVVRFELKEPFAPFLTALCRGIVPQKEVERLGDAFGRNPIGTGPYRFVGWVDESHLEFVANPHSFSAKPQTEHLIFRIIKDDNIRILKLIKGDLDFVLNAVPPSLLGKIRETPSLIVETASGTVMGYIGMNLRDPILKDPRVRRALALGIDRDEVIGHRRQGLAEKANSILSPITWGYDHTLLQIPYDPDAAKRLLDEAGYRDPDGAGPKMRFTLSFKTSVVKERVDIVRMYAHQLERIGVGIKVESYEWGTFFRDVKTGNFQLYSLQWVGVIDPDIFYDVFHSHQVPPLGMNRGYYRNPLIDQLVEEGRRTLDQQARKEIYAKVQEIVIKELPIIPLWYEQNVAVYRKGLTGVRLRPDASFLPFVGIAKQ